MEIEDILKSSQHIIKDKDFDKLNKMVKELFNEDNIKQITSKQKLMELMNTLGRKNKIIPSLFKVLNMYRSLCSTGELQYNKSIEYFLRTKNCRSLSGIVNITVFTSAYPNGQQFSCEYDCHYCPKEPDQPRSYLLKEPGVMRANQNKFISTDQFWDRAITLIKMGHPVDKIELIVSGGTFSSYPREYLTEFFRDQFYAANVTYNKLNKEELREKLSLQEEQDINQFRSRVKIIGITNETRPDRVNKKELEYFRELGITRVQMGVQHLNDDVLNHINRRCNTKHTIKAIKALKEAGFKVDIHIMPDLPAPPGLTPLDMYELDRKMFDEFINNPNFQADQWKVYPCETVPWTEIEKWYKDGTYKPYAEMSENGENLLFKLLMEVKNKVKPWLRLNRIVRDIPNSYIIGGNSNTSMRGDLIQEMEKRNLKCKCIRCREIKSKQINIKDFYLKVRQYDASDGQEYFISWENNEDDLLGFIRLRINSSKVNKYFPELNNTALIRELHVYGQVIQHDLTNIGSGVQHKGLGKKLIKKAIEIADKNGYDRIAVISGVGVRDYYIKQGFKPEIYYLNKKTMGNFLIMDNKIKKLYYKIFTNMIIMVIIFIIFYLLYENNKKYITK